MDDVTSKIKQEIDYCEKTQIKVNPIFAKTQINIIDLIEKYWRDFPIKKEFLPL
jgi:hypothetical protein